MLQPLHNKPQMSLAAPPLADRANSYNSSTAAGQSAAIAAAGRSGSMSPGLMHQQLGRGSRTDAETTSDKNASGMLSSVVATPDCLTWTRTFEPQDKSAGFGMRLVVVQLAECIMRIVWYKHVAFM